MSARPKLTPAAVSRIRELHARGLSQSVIARDARVTVRAVADVIHGRTHKERTTA